MRSTNLLEHVYLCLRRYSPVWVTPMILGLAIAGAYNKIFASKTFTARQSLILRDDLMGDAFKPSRFGSQEQLKSAQETVLEIARKPQVIRAVLEQLGPMGSGGHGDYPSLETIEGVQGNVMLSAPNGAEFGKTEAVVLTVKTADPERSRKFVALLLDQIDSKLNEVRLLRLDSMRSELSQASVNAKKSLETSSQRLQALEKSFGAEITTIRGLNDPQSGSGFDLKLNQIRLEQRQAAAQLASAKEQRELLLTAKRNGGKELVTSNELLQLQPALQGVMTNLSAAMAQLAIDEGRYTSLHPELQRSRRAVQQQKRQLFNSLGTTIKGLDSQIQTLSALERRLGKSVVELETKLRTLTEQRVPYATLEEEVKKKAEVYNEVQGRLAQVQSYATSTDEVAMLTRIDKPQVSSRPDQIGASTAGMLGGAVGLVCGLGLVILLSPPFEDPRSYVSQTPPSPTAEQRPSHAAPVVGASPVVQNVSPETVVESRLRTASAMQRQMAPPQPVNTQADDAGGDSGSGLVANAIESMIPDSVIKHMTALKQGITKGIVPQRNGEHPQAEAQPGPEKSLTTPSPAPVEPPEAAVAPVVVTAAAPTPATSAPASVGSAEVIAAFKAREAQDAADKAKVDARVAQAIASSPTHATPAAAPVQNGQPASPAPRKSVAVEKRSELTTFASAAEGKTQSSPQETTPPKSTAAKDEREPAKPIKDKSPPDILVVDRVRSPEVPESITNGRITAESLLSLSQQKKSSEQESEASEGMRKAEAPVPQKNLSALAHKPVNSPGLPGGINSAAGNENPGDASGDSGVTSITDYARALDRKLVTAEDDQIVSSANSELQPEGESSDGNRPQRSANARPLDIARSIGDQGSQRPPVGEIQLGETNGGSKQVQGQRRKSISDLVNEIDDSVAGLVKEAKRTDVQSENTSAVSSVASAEVAVSASTKPKPRKVVTAAAIPSQVRKLSGSFSSFARPSDSQE